MSGILANLVLDLVMLEIVVRNCSQLRCGPQAPDPGDSVVYLESILAGRNLMGLSEAPHQR